MWSLKIRKRWVRVVVRCFGCLLGLAVVVVVLGLYGNPQWHKRIYMFQVYTLRRAKDAQPPPGYTGLWVEWHRNGVKASETQYRKGRMHGKRIGYADDGRIAAEGNYENGEPQGTRTFWHRNGKKWFEAHHTRGDWDYKATWWDEQGKVIAEGTYRSGKPWDGTFTHGHYGRLGRWKEGKPWDGIFKARVEGGTRRLRFLENGVEVSSLILDRDLGRQSSMGKKPWRGRFVEWDEETRQLVVKVYSRGQVTQVHAGRFPAADSAPR